MGTELLEDIGKIERVRSEYELSLLQVINGLIKYLKAFGIEDIQKKLMFDTAINFNSKENINFYISLQGIFTITRTITTKAVDYKNDITETWSFNNSSFLFSKLTDLLEADE